MQATTRPSTLPSTPSPVGYDLDALVAIVGLATTLTVLAIGIGTFVDRASETETRPAIETTWDYVFGA